jgi:hypothetical protein
MRVIGPDGGRLTTQVVVSACFRRLGPGLFGSEPELFMKAGRVAEGSAAPLGC